jgi:small-conductance mechanosensitive channel
MCVSSLHFDMRDRKGVLPRSCSKWIDKRASDVLLYRPNWFGAKQHGSQGSIDVGHRLITALIFLNVAGFLACVVLIAAAISKDDPVVLAQVTQSVFASIRMFVIGAAVPTVAWGIAALEFDRSHAKKRWIASAVMYTLLVVSLVLFGIAGWRVPRALLNNLQIIMDMGDVSPP